MFKKANELKKGDVLIQRYSGYLNDILDLEPWTDRKGNEVITLYCDNGCSFTVNAEEEVECL